MASNKVRISRRWGQAAGVWLALTVVAGCAGSGPKVGKALKADRGATARNVRLPEYYQVRYPDVLEISLEPAPEWAGRHAIGLDGCLDLGLAGRVRVDGWNVQEIATRLADLAAVHPSRVQVRVVEYRSQHVYLCGRGVGSQRAISYQGPETVLDLLHRAGGITPGASPTDVHVVRSHLIDGQPPEVFSVDLPAILQRKDEKTNVRLAPFDQVYVGETRTSSLEKCVPPCFKLLYKALCGLL